uniref:DNA-directed RNA polymerase n=1 Tax=Euglena mutabilis TaxID=38275 RepID=A0A1B0UKX5_EUGMU|nr:RNA polymerase beta'' subunit [Euglena mutabilis]
MKKKSTININKNQTKNELKNLINWFTQNYGSLRTTKLVDSLKKLGFKYSTQAGISLGIEDLNIPKIKKELLTQSENKLGKMDFFSNQGYLNNILYMEKVVQTWDQTNEKLREEIINNFRQTSLINPLYMMTLSGARGNISQIKQLVGMRGLISDSQGEIMELPIKNNFREGLNIVEYFISCYGARKGLVDTALKTANSGYLTRRLIYTSQAVIIKQPNCRTKYKNLILGLKNNKKNYKNSKENLLGRILARDIKNDKNQTIIASEGQDICNFTFKKIIKSKKIYIRSPLTCKLNFGLCQLCYGWNLGNGRIAELGESIGIVAAQSIGEPGTQLTMRTFHTGGVFSGETNRIIHSPSEGKINYTITKDDKRIRNKYSEKTTIIKAEKCVFINKDKKNKYFLVLPANSIIFPKPSENIKYKQLIAEIPIAKKRKKKKIATGSTEIKSNFSGILLLHETEKKKLLSILSCNLLEAMKFQKLYYKNNIKNKKKTNKKFIKEKQKSILNKIKVNIETTKEKFKKFKTKKTAKTFNFIIEEIENKSSEIIFTNKRKTEKELKNKQRNNLTINTFSQEFKILKNPWFPYCFNILQKTRGKILIKKSNTKAIIKNSLIKKEKFVKKNNVLFYIYHESKKTKDIVQGLPKIEQILEGKRTSNLEKLRNNPHDKLDHIFSNLSKKFDNKIANRIAIEKVQYFLTKKIQDVYESQGINIANKHIEIIVKQMTDKVIIKEKGETKILPGEIIELNKIEKINDKVIKKASYEPLILGITKLGLNNQSFITASSFQETAKILTKAAIEGKVDWLNGLKENVILGKLIPSGTGFKKLLN